MASLNQVWIVYFASVIAVTAAQSNTCELEHARAVLCSCHAHTH